MVNQIITKIVIKSAIKIKNYKF